MANVAFRRDDKELAHYFADKARLKMHYRSRPGLSETADRVLSDDIKILARTAFHFAMNAVAQEEAEEIGRSWHATKASMRI